VLILEWSHPADTVRSLASSLARGLMANGFSVTTIDLTKRRHLAKLEAAGKDAFAHIFSLGCVGFLRRFNSEVQQRCIDDMAEHRGWGKGRGQGRKSPAAMRA
jgi:hypothetical protein